MHARVAIAKWSSCRALSAVAIIIRCVSSSSINHNHEHEWRLYTILLPFIAIKARRSPPALNNLPASLLIVRANGLLAR